MWMHSAASLAEQAIGVGRIVLLFVINFVAIWNLNSELAWMSIVTIPIILLVSIWFFKKVTKAYEDYQAQEAVLSTTLQENLTGVRVVKAFARQDYEKSKFEKDNWGKYLKGKILLFMHSMFWPLSDIVLGFQMLFGLCLRREHGDPRRNLNRHIHCLYRTCGLADLAHPQSWTHYCVNINRHGLVRAPDGSGQAAA